MLNTKHRRTFIIIALIFLTAIPIILYTKKGTAKIPGVTYTKSYHKEPNVNLTFTREELLDKKYSQANFLLNSDAKITIMNSAVESGSLFLEDNCNIEPVVIKSKRPLSLQLINEGKTKQQILMNGKSYQVSPSQSIKISDPMTSASEITRIYCGPSNAVSGYLILKN